MKHRIARSHHNLLQVTAVSKTRKLRTIQARLDEKEKCFVIEKKKKEKEMTSIFVNDVEASAIDIFNINLVHRRGISYRYI